MSYPQQPANWSDPAATPAPAGSAPHDPSSYPGAENQGAEYQVPGSYQAPAGFPPGAPIPGYGYSGYGYPVMIAKPTNGLAVASLVVSIFGAVSLCAYGVGGYVGIVGAILGHVARRQIKERDEAGDGLALAGVITGWIATGIAVLATVVIVVIIIAAVNTET